MAQKGNIRIGLILGFNFLFLKLFFKRFALETLTLKFFFQFSLSCSFVFSIGCVHKQTADGQAGTASSADSTNQSDLLFPNGTYQQEVNASVLVPGKEKDFDMNCVVQKNPEQFLFVGYNSFGISLFKVKETRDGQIEMESSIKQINQRKEFVMKIFSLVKSLTQMKKSDPRLKQPSFEVAAGNASDSAVDHTADPTTGPTVNSTTGSANGGLKSTVTFSEYNQQGIPLKIKVETPGLYQINIETTKVNLLK